MDKQAPPMSSVRTWVPYGLLDQLKARLGGLPSTARRISVDRAVDSVTRQYREGFDLALHRYFASLSQLERIIADRRATSMSHYQGDTAMAI